MRVSFRAAAAATVLVSGLTAVAGAGTAWAGQGASPASGTTKLWAAEYHGPSNYAQPGSLAVSPDGADLFVTGFADNRHHQELPATVGYDAATGAKLWSVVSATGGEDDIAVSPDSSTVFVAGTDTVAYDAATGAVKWTQAFPAISASRVAVSPNGQEVFATGYGDFEDNTVAYNAATGAVLWTAQLPSSGWPGGLVVSPDSGTLYVAGANDGAGQYQTVAYNAATGSQLWLENYKGPYNYNVITSAVLSPDGSQLVVTGQSVGTTSRQYDNATIAYDAATGATNWTQVSRGGPMEPNLAISPDGSTLYLAGGGTDPDRLSVKVAAMSAATGATLWTQGQAAPGGGAVEQGIAVSPDGSTVYVVGWGPTDFLTLAYNSATGAKAWQRDFPNGEGFAIAADPDGSAVFVTGVGFPYKAGGNQGFETLAYGS